MAMISFTCPNCAKVLRTSTRPPEGKKVKCPSCGKGFVPALDDEEEADATGIQDKPRMKAKASVQGSDDDDEKPRRKKSRDEVDDETDEDAPRKKHKRDDDNPPSIKNKKKKKSPSMVMIAGLLVVVGGGLLGCCGVLVGVGGWVWPGFFLSKGDLTAFVPSDANLVMGGNPKLVRAKAAHLEKLLREQGLAQQGNKQNELEDISLNSERMLAFATTKDFEKNNLIAVFQSTAGDIQKVKRNPNLGPAQTIGGHANVHKATAEGKRNGLPAFIAFPGNNVVVSSTNSEQELVAALSRGKQPGKPNATVELGRTVDRSPFWLAFTPDADTLAKLRQDMDKGGAMAPPTLKAAGPALSGVKGMTLVFDIDANQDIKFDANVLCKNPDDAGKIKAAIEDSWTMLKALLQLGALAPPRAGQPGMPPTLMGDLNSLTFTVQGANVRGNLKISSQTVEALAKLGAQQNFMGGGGQFQPDDFGQPKLDGGPKFDGGPKAGPNLNYNIKLTPGQKNEKEVVLQAGKRAVVTVGCNFAQNQSADIDVFILRGKIGEQVVAQDAKGGPNRNLQYTVPAGAGDFYRIRVVNRGPGTPLGCFVSFSQF